MNKSLVAFSAALIAAVLFCAQPSSAYTLLPAPQKLLFQGDAFSVNPDGVTLSASFKSHDPRVLKSLQQIFPDAKVSSEDFVLKRGGTFVYATNALNETTKKCCAIMLCQDITPDKIPSQGYFLGIRRTDAGNIVLIIFNDAYGEFYATKTLKQIFEDTALHEVSIYDWPDFKVRGVLEGFYGKPWPEKSRTSFIPWMADYKFNIYIYAPKDDYKLRMGWRISFTEGETKKVVALNQLSKENFIKYCWELSPGMSVNFSNQKDTVSAYKKMKSIIAAGAECLALAFDDVGPTLTAEDRGKFDTYWQGQMFFTNKLVGKLLEEYPDIMFSFVPNDYWGSLAAESEYLRYIGKHLDKRIQIGYTGNEIIPATVTPSDISYYEYYIKRKPILGDNYPVSDYVNQGGRLSLGPLRGRDPNLFKYVAAFAANAMPLPESSKPALLTIADYVWNPFNYDADASWSAAMQILGGAKGADTLLFFAKQSESSLLWKYDALDLFEATRGLMRAVKNLPDYNFDEYYEQTSAIFKRYASMDNDMEALRNPANTAMLDEIAPWIKKTKDYGDIGLAAIDFLKEKYNGKAVDPAKIDALEARWKKIEENKAVMTKMVMNNFMLLALASLRNQPEPDLKKYKSVME